MKGKKQIELPQYLDMLKPYIRTYGTLEKVKLEWLKGEPLFWKIEAEPHVMQLVRRIFRVAKGDYKGVAYIEPTMKHIADLNWFMMRYPLKIKNKQEFYMDYVKARQHVEQRMLINTKIQRPRTPKNFNGELFKFQKHGLAYISHNRRSILADEMGLGKTVQALALLCKDNKFPVLIVTPPHLLLQWESETKRFLGDNIKTHIMKGLTPYEVPEADVYFIHYLIIRGWYKELQNMGFDSIIFDEVQELRRPQSEKYLRCKQIVDVVNPSTCIGLSGTPIYNYGCEIYFLYYILKPDVLGTWESFRKEWAKWGRMVEDPEALGSYLKEEGMLLRRRKEDVLSELPPKRRAVQLIGLDEKLYLNLYNKSVEIAKEIPLAKDNEKAMLVMNAVNNIRRASGISKSQHVAEFVRLLLEAKEPVLLYAYHHDVVDQYAKYLKKFNPGFITGRQNQIEKRESEQRFMEGKTDLLIINLRTTAGLNLQRARAVVFGELDFSPAVHTQAEDRAHRIGQKDSVMAYYLVAQTPSDMEIIECLGVKAQQFKGIMQDRNLTETEKFMSQRDAQSYMWNVIKRLEEKEGKQYLTIDQRETNQGYA